MKQVGGKTREFRVNAVLGYGRPYETYRRPTGDIYVIYVKITDLIVFF